jgi:hypothetical protein
MLLLRLSSLALTGLTIIAVPGSAQAPRPAPLPPAPILLRWPEPAFEPARQCHGEYGLQDLERFLPPSRLGLWVPSTRTVELDEGRRCIIVTVDDVGTGRLIELLLRGVAVPRHAVVLQLSERPGA